MRPIFSGSARPVVSVKDRAVPASRTESGMMLNAVPPWIQPIVTTAESSGEISRDTTVCSASTMRAAATIGSAVSCGAAPCPPRPSTSIAKWSTAAMSAPRLIADPADGQGAPEVEAERRADALEHAVVGAGLRAALALLGRLEEEAHRARRASSRASRSATASAIATCPSCPHACMRPGIVEA